MKYLILLLFPLMSFGQWEYKEVIDYGTYREIDRLKCIRYKQMQWKMYHLEKLNEKSCE